MWEGCYGKEPFDLRLTVLRFLRNFWKMLLLTLVGALIFGGGYYVKNIVFRPAVQYSTTTTFKVDYTVPPVESNDYYINEMTWNTLVQSTEFVRAVQAHLLADSAAFVSAGENGLDTLGKEVFSEEALSKVISAKLPSDWAIPTVTVVTPDRALTEWITGAVELAMQTELVDFLAEVKSIRVMTTPMEATEVEVDVRPGRAFALSAILSFFFAACLFVIKELGEDSIWLPSTLKRRYGLNICGTIYSRELQENLSFLFKDMGKIGVCSVDDTVDTTEVARALVGEKWIPLPGLQLCPEGVSLLRRMEGILLVVKAGSHAGKPLEYTLEYLSQQDCKVTAVLLWKADERLIDAYYGFRKKMRDKVERQ